MTANPSAPAIASLLLALTLAFPLPAQELADNFNDGNDTGWTRLIPLQEQGLGGAATYSFPNGNSYRIVSAVSPNPAAAGPARAGSYRSDASYTAFRIEVDLIDWNPALNQDIGLLARMSSPGLGTLDGYAWAYETGENPPTVYLSRLDGEEPSILGSAAVTLTAGEAYRFVFEGFLDQFRGQIFLASDLENPLASVFAFDSAHLSGFGGFFNNSVPDGGTTDSTFDNYFSTTTTDVDGDGMTDQWEFAHFGDLFWWGDDDNDGDGQTNLEEFIGGSDPTNPGSLSGIRSVTVSGGEVTVNFPLLDGRIYALETTPDLITWTPQPAAVFAENGATGSLTVPTGGLSPLFVRVRATVMRR